MGAFCTDRDQEDRATFPGNAPCIGRLILRILTYRTDAGLKPGVVQGDSVVDLVAAWTTLKPSPAAPDSVEALLAGGPSVLEHARKVAAGAVESAPEHLIPLAGLRFAPPVTRPQKIIGVGLNYRDHCEEINRPIPTAIQTFGMFTNTLIGHNEPIELARKSEKMDWEAELVVVIGKPGKHIPLERAMDHVAGFTIGNDVSARDFQAADPQAMRGKSGDTHAPLGPWIVLRDELPDDSDLRITLTLNGEVKQDSNTGNRTFDTADIVSYLSGFFTLRPGDLIYTGTPGGVGMGRDPQEWLKPGDRIEISVGRIGVLANTCVMEPERG